MSSKVFLFRTRNSLYTVDAREMTVTGGVFKDNVERYRLIESSLIGGPLVIHLEDGKVLKTSNIEAYI